MSVFTTSMLAVLAMLVNSASAKDGRTFAVVRHSGNPIVQARMDPIISPGAISGHVHNVIGGTGFSESMGPDDALNAKGTTANVNGDGSNYWFPEIYFHHDNGSFTSVKPTQFNTYYL